MNKKTSKQLASDLAERERRLVELRGEQDGVTEALGEVSELRARAADAELAVDLDAAGELRARATKIEVDARAREGELAALVPRLEALIERTKADIERAIFDETVAQRDEKAKQAAKVAGEIAAGLKRPLSLAEKLEELREDIDNLDTEARRLARPLNVPVPLPKDEPAFGDALLLKVLAAGARTPNVQAAKEARLRAAHAAQTRESMIDRAVRDELRGDDWCRPSGDRHRRSAIEKLPEQLQAEAVKRFAKAIGGLPEQIRPSREHHLTELRERVKQATGTGEDERESGSGVGAEQGRSPLPV